MQCSAHTLCGNVKTPGSGTDRARFGKVDQVFQILDFHSAPLCCLSCAFCMSPFLQIILRCAVALRLNAVGEGDGIKKREGFGCLNDGAQALPEGCEAVNSGSLLACMGCSR